jgi:hypothetical protein
MSDNKKKRANLLAELEAEMTSQHGNVTTSKHDNTTTLDSSRKPKLNIPWYPPSKQLHKALKQLALDEDSSVNKLLTEGIALVLEKRGKSIDDYL